MRRDKYEDERIGGGGGSSWISYSDMMASLLLVFVLMLCVSLLKYFTAPKEEDLRQQQTIDEQLKEIEARETELTKREKALAEALEQLEKDREELRAAQEQLKQDQEELKAAQEQLKQDQDALKAAQEQLKKDQEALKAAQEQLKQDQDALKAAQEQLKQDQEALKAAQEQLKQDQEALKAAQEQLKQDQEALKAAQEQLKQDQEALKAAQEQMIKDQEALKAAQEQLKKDQEALKAAQEQLTRDQEALRAAQEQLTRDQEALRVAQEQLEKKEQALEQEKKELEEARAALDRDRAELEKEKAALEKEKEQLKQDQADLKAERDQLDLEREAFRMEKEAFEKESKASKEATAAPESETEWQKEKQRELQKQQALLDQYSLRRRIIASQHDAFEDSGLNITINQDTGEISTPESILFDPGSSELSEAGKRFLDTFIPQYLEVLMRPEYESYISEVVIEGHTDSAFSSAIELSQDRAVRVMAYSLQIPVLTEAQRACLSEKTSFIGRGFTDPIIGENGQINREASRRVGIKFQIRDNDLLSESELIGELSGRLEAAGISATVDPETGDVLPDGILFFNEGKDELTVAGKVFVRKFLPVYLDVMMKAEYQEQVGMLIIEGTTDQKVLDAEQLDLGQRRATRVMEYCMQQDLTEEQKAYLQRMLITAGKNTASSSEGTDENAERHIKFRFQLKNTGSLTELRNLFQDN